jgi:hypothetical protein
MLSWLRLHTDDRPEKSHCGPCHVIWPLHTLYVVYVARVNVDYMTRPAN